MRRPDVKVPGPVPFPSDLPGGLGEPAMADLTRPIKPRSHDCSHAGISHERLARRRYAPCPRFWRLLFDPRSFRDTRRLANPEVSDGDVTLGWPWDSADRVFGPYGSRHFDIGSSHYRRRQGLSPAVSDRSSFRAIRHRGRAREPIGIAERVLPADDAGRVKSKGSPSKTPKGCGPRPIRR